MEEKVKEIKVFLDNLRESGITNMFGAVPYIMDEFPELTKSEATQHLKEWMVDF